MKNLKLLFALAFVVLSTFGFVQDIQAQNSVEREVYTFMQMTTIESVVPAKLGRSRMILSDDKGDVVEVKMQNFFSMVGINFKNVRSNDQLIAKTLGDLSEQGWELVQVSPGVYGTDSNNGIFITRYLLRRPK